MSEEFAVELQNVVKKFGSVTAVDHVSLQILDGEFFSLLGPSGCGKTTTLRMIAGFDIPTQGDVYIAGKLQGYLPAFQRPVNTVFQHYALFPHMSVFQNVAFGLEMKSIPKSEIERRVSEVLDMVHLKGMENRRPRQLSGGQQQRVALARALVNHPKVLLLDEPLGALDLKLRKAMQVELKALQDRVGITFIYVTHDQEEALTMSDRIAVMHQGKLLQVGTSREVYEAPRTRFVSDFIGQTNYLEGLVVNLDGELGTIFIEPDFRITANIIGDVKVGDRTSVAFRPEKCFLNTGQADGMNTITGKLVNIVYTGEATTFHITLPDNSTIVGRQQNVDIYLQSSLQVNDTVTLYWPIAVSKAFKE